MLALFAIAWACPPTAERVEEAKGLFNDAEIDAARDLTQEALDELSCQIQVVERGTLLELYRLDAQIALVHLDRKTATYATIRSVAVDPGSIPTEDYGPELAELHRVWADRLKDARIELSVTGGGVVYLDGMPMVQGERLETLRGEHLVQIDSGTAVVSTVTDLDQDQSVVTGLEVDPDEEVQPVAPKPDPVPANVPIAPPEPEPDPKVRRKRRPSPAIMIAGGAIALLGGGALTYAMIRDERQFIGKPYANIGAVEQEAGLIRSVYATGYGLVGVGAVVTGVGTVGRGVRMEGRWRF